MFTSFNRTIVELKLRNICPSPSITMPFNRTIVELKFAMLDNAYAMAETFNRTIVELKWYMKILKILNYLYF